jgi:putative membrane protein
VSDTALIAGDRRRRSAIRLWPICLYIVGLGLAAWLISAAGPSGVVEGLRAVGWLGLLAIVGIHAVASLLMGLAWWLLRRSGPLATFVWGRLVRDAGSEILPLSQAGGLVMAISVLLRAGLSPATAIAVTLVDATLEFAAQLAYVGLGVVLAARSTLVNLPHWPIYGLLAVTTLVASSTVLPRRCRFARRVGAQVARRCPASVLQRIWTVRGQMADIVRCKAILPVSILLHFAAWNINALEAWLALHFMGATLDIHTVVTLESLVYGARGLGFMVPSAIGIQEGVYVVLGAAVGLSPDVSLGVSLVKRGRDLILGTPALVAWSWIGMRRSLGPASIPRRDRFVGTGS